MIYTQEGNCRNRGRSKTLGVRKASQKRGYFNCISKEIKEFAWRRREGTMGQNVPGWRLKARREYLLDKIQKKADVITGKNL